MEIYKKGSRGEMVKRIQRVLYLLDDGIFGIQTEEAVKAYQRMHGIKADGIVGVRTAALMFGTSILPKPKRYINKIIIHCTATPEGRNVTVEDIRRWHKAQGWSDIGYHYVIYLDGSVHIGRDIEQAGAHCSGYNAHSIGVVYVGGTAADGKTPKDTRTPLQKFKLKELLQELRKKYPYAKIYGHRDFANKACPSFDATREYSQL